MHGTSHQYKLCGAYWSLEEVVLIFFSLTMMSAASLGSMLGLVTIECRFWDKEIYEDYILISGYKYNSK